MLHRVFHSISETRISIDTFNDYTSKITGDISLNASDYPQDLGQSHISDRFDDDDWEKV